MGRLGLGYAEVSAVHPAVIYLRCRASGTRSPRLRLWPAFAPWSRPCSASTSSSAAPATTPMVAPVGSARRHRVGLYAVIRVLAALRHRDATGPRAAHRHRHARCMVAMTTSSRTLVAGPARRQPWRRSSGRLPCDRRLFIIRSAANRSSPSGRARRRAGVGRRPALRRPSGLGRPPRRCDPARGRGCGAADRQRLQACEAMSAAGLAGGTCYSDDEVVHDRT